MNKKIILVRIDELLEEKHISKYELRENTEVSSTIYQWRKNATRDKDRTPSLKSIEKICEYLGVSLAYFFAFDSLEQRDIRQYEITELIKGLSQEQILLLEQLIKQFKVD